MSAKKKPPKHCECALKVNKLLASQNAELVLSYRMQPKGRQNEIVARAIVECVKANPKIRVKPRTLVATFCPFCGVEYPRGLDEKTIAPKGGT